MRSLVRVLEIGVAGNWTKDQKATIYIDVVIIYIHDA
jgi:hypothetical protein